MPRSLWLRPGARYECHGDGTCCTNIHLLGPVTTREATRVRRGAPLALPRREEPIIEYHDGIKALVLVTHDHACVFLDRKAQCRFHAAVGAAEKPAVCRHFPLGATSTQHGLRISLSHRCPCVSIGDSALLDEQRARAVLASPTSGRIAADVHAPNRIRWRGRKKISFDEYVAWETELLEQLTGDRKAGRIETALGMNGSSKLPPLRGTTWAAMGKRMLSWSSDQADDDGFFCAVRWAASVLSTPRTKRRITPQRPWAWTLERTEKRTRKASVTREVYGAWLADFVWAMTWAVDGSVYRTMADMTARYVIARRLAERFRRAGARADVAAAEAIMIVDTVGASEAWGWVEKSLVEPPAGTY